VTARRVGIIQSSYIPWRGYFDFIRSVDLFVIYDDIQYPVGRSWRSRNQIKTRYGLRWLTVPVSHDCRRLTVDRVAIASTEGKPWQSVHRNLLIEALGKAPFFNDAIGLWEEGISKGAQTISELNVHLIKSLCRYFGIQTPIVLSRDYEVNGAKTERLINLLKKTAATVYVSGPSARNYIEEDLFRKAGIGLEYKTYEYDPYPQLWGEFIGAVSALDLIANVGSDANRFLASKTSNIVALQ
jgi:WbqC-like protein